MPTLGELAGVSSGISGHAASRIAAKGGPPISMTVILQGQRVLIEDLITLAYSIPPMSAGLTLYFGQALAEVAKQIHMPNIDTQKTYDSISAGPQSGGGPQLYGGGTQFWIDVGPHTEYAPWQEFGFVHHLSGEWIQNPFMIPAADVIDPLFTDAMIQLVEIAGRRRYFDGPAAQSPAANFLSGIRNFLYSYSKFAGDIQVLGFGGLSASRGAATRGARLIGDTTAGMRGAIGTRISRRISGRFASGGLSTSISTTLTGPGGSFTGPSRRIYNRIAGQTFGSGLRGLP